MAFDAVPWVLDSTTIDGEVIRRAIGTLIGSSGGVVTPGDLQVTQNGTPNMSVNVGTGQIWVPGTSTSSQGPYYGRNGASENVVIAAANATNPRVDTIVVQVEDPAYGGSGTPMAPKSIEGTPTAGVSTPPTTAAQAASDGAASVPASAYVLGYVLVPANATTITNADISNVATQFAAISWTPLTLRYQSGVYNFQSLRLTPSVSVTGNRAMLKGEIGSAAGSTTLAVGDFCAQIPSSAEAAIPTAAVNIAAAFANGTSWSPGVLQIDTSGYLRVSTAIPATGALSLENVYYYLD